MLSRTKVARYIKRARNVSGRKTASSLLNRAKIRGYVAKKKRTVMHAMEPYFNTRKARYGYN